MAEFPEKESLDTDEFSTIFSDPKEHRDTIKKPKKILPKILAGVACLGILIGSTVAVVKLIPKRETEETAPQHETVIAKNLNSDDLLSVKIKNAGGEAEIYSEEVIKEGSNDIDWYLRGVDGALTVSMNIEKVATTVAKITASRKITAKTAEDCGFENPSVTAFVTPREETAYTVLLGAKSPDNGGYYLKFAEQDDIYLVSDDVFTALQFDVLDFANSDKVASFDAKDATISDYYDNEVIAKFDKLVIKDKDNQEPLIIVDNSRTATSEYYSYMITSPEQKLLATGRLDELTALYTNGITTEGAYSYDVSPESLKKVGLDNPDLETTMYLGNKSITYKFALQKDGYYAVVGDSSKLIHKVNPSILSGVVDIEYKDYYATALFVVNISDMANFTVTTAEKNFSFDLVKNNVAEDETDPEKLYTITSEGRKLTVSNFQNFYLKCVSLQTKDFITDNITSKPEITFNITLHNGSKITVEFTKVNATRYQCVVDGMNMGRVTATSLNSVLKDAEKASLNETVVSNW